MQGGKNTYPPRHKSRSFRNGLSLAVSRAQVTLPVDDYAVILDTKTPAPTVRRLRGSPKRSPSSIAIGAISSTLTEELSPA